jgi:hypothetical protein
MPFATSKDQKQDTNQFLLSPAVLSIWIFRMRGNSVVGIGVLDKGGNDVSYIFTPCSIASNSGVNLD